jgi:hypothetical protein
MRELARCTADITDALVSSTEQVPRLPSGSIAGLEAISATYSKSNWHNSQQLKSLIKESMGLPDDLLDSAADLLALSAGRVRTLATTGNPLPRDALYRCIEKALASSPPRNGSEAYAQCLKREKLLEVTKSPAWQALTLKLGRDCGGMLHRRGAAGASASFVPTLESAVAESLVKDHTFLRLQAQATGLDASELIERYKLISLRTGAASNRTTLITSLAAREVNETVAPARGQMVSAQGTFSFGHHELFSGPSLFRFYHDFYGVPVRSEGDAPGEVSQVFFPRVCIETGTFDKLMAHREGQGFLRRLSTISSLSDHDYLHVLDLALALDIASSHKSDRLRSGALRLPIMNRQRGRHMDYPPHQRGYEFEVTSLHREALRLLNNEHDGRVWRKLHEHFEDACGQLSALLKGDVLSQKEASACLLLYCHFYRLGREIGQAEFEVQRDCLPLPGFNLKWHLARTNYFDHANLAVKGLSLAALKRDSARWLSEQLKQSWALLDRCL